MLPEHQNKPGERKRKEVEEEEEGQVTQEPEPNPRPGGGEGREGDWGGGANAPPFQSAAAVSHGSRASGGERRHES